MTETSIVVQQQQPKKYVNTQELEMALKLVTEYAAQPLIGRNSSKDVHDPKLPPSTTHLRRDH